MVFVFWNWSEHRYPSGLHKWTPDYRLISGFHHSVVVHRGKMVRKKQLILIEYVVLLVPILYEILKRGI